MSNIRNYFKNPEISFPVDTLEELFELDQIRPRWCSDLIKRKARGSEVIKNDTMECHTTFKKSKLAPTRYSTKDAPRTIICHDMKNGYLNDKYVAKQEVGNCYTFYRWQNIDMFIYFSHHFITIPPLHWVNLAHKNGVKILGTFITEWDVGAALCKKITTNSRYMFKVIATIVSISEMFKLDGWLINIENKVANTFMLRMFVDYLTSAMHKAIEGSVVLWYDSVDRTGDLKWQNELNYSNCCFFNLCDGIFLNYSWREQNLVNSLEYARDRLQDVYVGIDVFGRNTPYGPGYDCYKGVALARKYNLSVALFAPGWTHESIDPNPISTHFRRFLQNDQTLWRALWPYLYTHPLIDDFFTEFYLGSDPEMYDLGKQELQLTHLLHIPVSAEIDKDDHPSKRSCNCLQLSNEGGRAFCTIQEPPNVIGKDVLCHLFATDIMLKGEYIVRMHTKTDNSLELVFVLLVDDQVRVIKLRMGPYDENVVDEVLAKATLLVYYGEECYNENEVAHWQHSISQSSILSFHKEQRLLHIYALCKKNDILLGFQLRNLVKPYD